MPLQGEGKVFGVSKLNGSSQKGKHHLNSEGKIPCLESKGQPREKRNFSTNPHHPTFSESQLSPQGLATTLHSSPTGFLPDHGNKSAKLKPQIIGRVMSEIHSNLPHKDFASEDFLHVLVDRVMAEVANEINLYDKGAPLIFPALAQTNMLPKRCCQSQKCCQPHKTESLSSQTYEENSNSSIEARKPSNRHGQTEEVHTERKSPPSEITVSVVLSESSTESLTPSECSEECCPEVSPGFCKNFIGKAKKLLTSRNFWWTIFLLLFILGLLFMCIILGAFLGLAICGPHSCSRTMQSQDTFQWIYLKQQSHDSIGNIHGLF